MDNFENSLTTAFTIGIVILITALYQWSSWSWKARPWIPFMLGLTILLGAALLDWRVESQIATTRTDAASLSAANKQQPSQLLSALATLGEHQLKLLELIAIPLAVSLIVAAILLRVDLEFSFHVSEYSKGRRDLRSASDAAKTAEANVEKALTNGLLGQELLNLQAEALFRQRIALRLFMNLDKRFAKLVDARIVPGLDDDRDET